MKQQLAQMQISRVGRSDERLDRYECRRLAFIVHGWFGRAGRIGVLGVSTFKQEETTTRNSNEPGQNESDIDTATAESRDGLTMAECGIEMDVFYHGDREEYIPETI